MTTKKGERPPTADEMSARRLDVLRANSPTPRKDESPDEGKKRLDFRRKKIREAKTGRYGTSRTQFPRL